MQTTGIPIVNLWPNVYKETQTKGIPKIVNLWPNAYKETQTTGIHVCERHKEDLDKFMVFCEEQGKGAKLNFWNFNSLILLKILRLHAYL